MAYWECGCGADDCDSYLDLRVGPVFFDETKEGGWLHTDSGDTRGKYVELMIDPATARDMARWMFREYLLPRWVRNIYKRVWRVND